MKFTPGQIREILPISQDTFRHWKSILPPLAGRNGYTRCFSPGDLLAMAAIKMLTEDLGIRVGTLQALSTDLFDQLNRNSWTGLERSTLIVEPLRGCVSTVPEAQPQIPDALAILLPCRPIIAGLRERLLLEHEEPKQEPLRFPPTAVTGERRRGGAS
jgi:DNA-binding transcriptional MerR regulator